jgi:hypothetical protein
MSEWKNLDKEKPEINEHVLIYKNISRDLSSYEEVIYTDAHDLPLMFHSLDFQYGYPEIKNWLKLFPPNENK